MAKITDPSKLLPSAKSGSIVRIDKSNFISPIKYKKSTTIIRRKKDTQEIGGKLLKIESFLKSDFISSQKKAEVTRKEKEKKDFDEAEKRLEFPKLKGFSLPKISLPSIGFFERVKRFLFFTALGWLLPKILDILPKLKGFGKVIVEVYKFAEGMFGKLFDGFMSLVKFGGDLKDKTLGFIATAKAGLGGNYQKEFDKLEKQFNTFVNASIIAGVLAADIGGAAIDEFNKQRGKKPPKGEEPKGKPKPRGGKPRVTEGRGGKPVRGKPKITGDVKPSWWNRIFKGPFAKLKGPLTRFAGVAVPGLGAAVGVADAAARFKAGDKIGGVLASVSAALDAATAAAALTGIGLPVAGILGTISMSIDVILLIRDILRIIPGIPEKLLGFYRGGRVVRRYQGGGSTRGGKPVGGAPKRTITSVRKRKPSRISLPKVQPGKDVGGEKKIKKYYGEPDPTNEDLLLKKENSNLLIGQQPSPFRTLKKMSGTLKSDETLAKGILGLMSSGIDIALGQKPDKNVFKSFFNTIGYVSDTLASQRANMSMGSLMSQLRGFAEGGTVPSRELKKTYDINTGDMLAKILSPKIDQKVNEAIRSIEKELRLKIEGAGGEPGAGPDGNGGGGGPSVESIDMNGLSKEDVDALGRMVQAEAGNQSAAGKASVMNVILNRYRLAKAGKGYLPSGKTKDTVTIRDILYDPNQFSPIHDGRFDRTSSSSGRSALAQAISAGGNDPEKLKKVLMEKYNLNEQDANYVIVSTAFSNPESRGSRPFNTREVTVGDHTFQESPDARLRSPGQKIDATVKETPSLIIKGGPIKGGAIVIQRGDPDNEQTGSDIAVGNYKVGAQIQNPFQSLKITKIDFQGKGSGESGQGFGRYVTGETIINGKRYEILLGHLNKALVKEGDILEAGDVIGTQGISGHATGPHVSTHINALDGGDPSKILSSVEYVWKRGGAIETKSMGRPTSQSQPPKAPPGQTPGKTGPVVESFKVGSDTYTHRQGGVYTKNGKRINKDEFDKSKASQTNWWSNLFGQNKPTSSAKVEGVINYRGQTYYKQGDKYFKKPGAGEDPIQIPKGIYDTVPIAGTIREGGNLQGGGIIAPPKPNRPIPNSFASYETPGNGIRIAIQPMIFYIEKPSSRTIDFPMIVPISVNSSMTDLSSMRG